MVSKEKMKTNLISSQRTVQISTVIALTMAMGLLSSCSYFKRKDCEAINWHQYAYNLALKGTRPSNDDYLNQCRKIESEISETAIDSGFKEGMSKYCTADQAFLTGKNGLSLNMDLCDAGQIRMLMAKHQEGVTVYCLPENAFTIGSTGKKPTDICPKNLEAAFSKEYKRGRKQYLNLKIQENESGIHSKEAEIQSVYAENSQLTYRLATLPQPREIIERVYDPVTKQYTQTQRTEDAYASERANLRGKFNSNDSRVVVYRQEIKQLQDENSKNKIEMQGY